MNHPPHAPRRAIVIGGGISGLAAAHRLVELDQSLDVTLFEASGQLGGVLQTERRDGYLIERSADNFITNVPWGIDLCRRVGLGDALLPTNAAQRRAFVVHRGRPQAVPEGFMLMAPRQLGSVLTTPILSPWGKLRLAAELLVPARRDEADESLASFARRRLGREAFERLVQPLVSGIYTADPEKLSLRAALPRFYEMERRHGSLIRAARHEPEPSNGGRAASGARYGLFAAPRDGMGSLVDAIARRLPKGAVRLNSPVESLARRDDGRWSVTAAASDGGKTEVHEADAVIVALPAPLAARLVERLDAELSSQLAGIAYAGCVIVVTAYAREQFARPLEGFGFVVPECERRSILACSYSSEKFPGRAPEGQVLLRVFLGGACHPEMEALSDDELRSIVARELRELLGVRAAPHFAEVYRWSGAMPQYHVGHLDRVAAIERRLEHLPGLRLCGNAYAGVGVPQCIHQGEQAAEAVLAPAPVASQPRSSA